MLKCEVLVKEVLPAIRAALVRELVERHHLSQVEVARRLGVTQPAVCQYLKMVRGASQNTLAFKVIRKKIRVLAYDIAQEKLDCDELTARYCIICKSFRNRRGTG